MPGIALPGVNIGKGFPGGIAFDRADNLLFVDQDAKAVYVYAPPYSAVTSTIHLKGTAVYCALNPAQTRLECMDYEYAAVDSVYSYPAGRYLFSFNNTIGSGAEAIGIATSRY